MRPRSCRLELLAQPELNDPASPIRDVFCFYSWVNLETKTAASRPHSKVIRAKASSVDFQILCALPLVSVQKIASSLGGNPPIEDARECRGTNEGGKRKSLVSISLLDLKIRRRGREAVARTCFPRSAALTLWRVGAPPDRWNRGAALALRQAVRTQFDFSKRYFRAASNSGRSASAAEIFTSIE